MTTLDPGTETSEKLGISLDQIPANRSLVDLLYSHGKINREARDQALKLLIPHNQWGLWAGRLLLGLGVCLVLSGIVYFFAFNWAKLLPAHKLGAIEFAIIASLIGACVCSLNRLSGQLALLSASVMVGVFMAVFGQIYQTGADAYQLFMMWALLTLGWTVISNFAAHWIFWLTISNVFIVLWWFQALLPDETIEPFILPLMMLFNGTALVIRELLAPKASFSWLAAGWTRWVLLITTIAAMLTPILMLIVDPEHAYEGVLIGALAGSIGHVGAFLFYRLVKKDIWSLAATSISGLIIVETTVIKVLSEVFRTEDEVMFLTMGLMTIGVVTGFTIFLRQLTSRMEAEHA